MLWKFSARSVYIAAESTLTSPVMSTGEKRSTLPASFTWARELGAEERPLTVPVSARMPAEKLGWMEKSEKFVLPFSIVTVPMRMGMAAAGFAGAFGAAAGAGARTPA